MTSNEDLRELLNSEGKFRKTIYEDWLAFRRGEYKLEGSELSMMKHLDLLMRMILSGRKEEVR